LALDFAAACGVKASLDRVQGRDLFLRRRRQHPALIRGKNIDGVAGRRNAATES
jgi:hypothetical protein